jgi:hypothetical protein
VQRESTRESVYLASILSSRLDGLAIIAIAHDFLFICVLFSFFLCSAVELNFVRAWMCAFLAEAGFISTI